MEAARRWLAGGSLLLCALALALACSGDSGRPAPPTGRTATATPTATSEPTTTAGRVATPLPTAEPTSTPDLGMILPDLQTAASDEVYITVNAGGVRLLHFSTEVHNTGAGPMQIVSDELNADLSEDGTVAWQIIETRTAGS